MLIDHDDLALGDLPIVNLERGPAQRLKIVEGVLVQLSEVEKLLREAVRLATLAPLVEKLLEPLILRSDISQLLIQVGDAVVVLTRVRVPDELAVIAAENNCWAIDLMLENILIGGDLLTAAISVAALELDFRQEIPRDAVYLIKLRVAAAEGAMIWVLREPVTLAV